MARYHFDIETKDKSFKDESGSECIDRQSVRDIAIASLPMIAAEDLPDGDDYSATVVVRDETGEPLFKAKLTVTASWLTRSSGLQ